MQVRFQHWNIIFTKNYQTINFENTYRRFTALLLAVVLINSLLIHELHHYTEHDHGDDFKCEVSGSETHFHGDELTISDCWVCTFQFSPKQSTDVLEVNFTAPVSTFQKGFFYENSSFEKVAFHYLLRGPPIFIS